MHDFHRKRLLPQAYAFALKRDASSIFLRRIDGSAALFFANGNISQFLHRFALCLSNIQVII
jgi:hypothetical protein